MKLKITKTKKTSILYVQKAYRDKNGKSTSKIHERLGTPIFDSSKTSKPFCTVARDHV